MKKLLLIFCIFISNVAFGQNDFTATIIDEETEEPLVGARIVIEGTALGALADDNGQIKIQGVPNGIQVLTTTYIGYETRTDSFTFPYDGPQPVVLELESDNEIETVHITTTRSSRTIEDIPTRTEAITLEELGEKALMNSTNIAMLLRESTGIMVQQTSANSANQSLRIQGLDGRYTQLLKDGFPLFGGFSSGLSVMQIPPLDLRQVEVVKGSASTLYGGGAIAGLVNLVTKQPVEDKPELSLMLTQTTALGTTGNIFWSRRFRKTGFTLYGSAHNQVPYDPNKDDFSDIPKVRSISVNPKFFWYPTDSTKIWVGLNTAFEDRLGGDVKVIEGNEDSLHTYTEQNLSKRISTQFHAEHSLGQAGVLTLRNSVNFFDRRLEIPAYSFGGQQVASFSEASWTKEKENTDWIVGVNLFTDKFTENDTSAIQSPRSYDYLTAGAFAQNNWDISESLILESGIRTDFNPDYGLFPLPRVSLLVKPNRNFTSRIGGGMGYKLPTIFTEEAEIRSFQNILPINPNSIEPEKSIGANFDLNYKTLIGEKLAFSINQLFFYTRLTNPLVLEPDSANSIFSFANADGPIESRGFETNVKFSISDFKLYLQYAFVDVKQRYDNTNNQKPLTPKHNAGAILMYEQEGKWRVGYEVYYVGQQFRSDYSKTQDYWMMGLMVQRKFKHFSAFVNFENFTDARQSRYQSMITPPHSNPSFTEIWAPTDGFVGSIGLTVNLYSEDDE